MTSSSNLPTPIFDRGYPTLQAARTDSEISLARYVLVSPCRNEEAYMRNTLDTVAGQSLLPALWVIIDDGSTDSTPEILREYAERYSWIRIITKPDRGRRAVGPGVVEAFYFGLSSIEIDDFDFVCKLDLDLDLPKAYFENLILRMEANPRIGTCSGKPYFRTATGALVSEKCGDEMSVGMSKFYRVACFKDVGGFVSQVMWDAIDCHKARQIGWIACSWDVPELRFEHLRPMGSSQKGILTGRMRHGYGQYYMGSDFYYFTATCLYRLAHPPHIIGGIASWWGFVCALARGSSRHPDPELRAYIRRYQRRAMLIGKRRAIAEIEAEAEQRWCMKVLSE